MVEDEIKKSLSYDPHTGIVRWVNHPRRTTSNGSEAGNFRSDGYRKIKFQGKQYLAHRIAWLLHTGAWPTGDVDHINGNPGDNRIENLRDVPHSINLQNRKSAASTNKVGLLGVVKRRNSYAAHVHRNGKQLYLGRFATAELAHKAYMEAT